MTLFSLKIGEFTEKFPPRGFPSFALLETLEMRLRTPIAGLGKVPQGKVTYISILDC